MAGKSHGLRLQDSGPCSERSPLRAAWPTWLCRAPLSSGPGMWRWSLHKKVERDPGKSPALVRILLRELEKVGSRASRGQQELEEERPIHCGLSPVSAASPKLWLFVGHLHHSYHMCLPPVLFYKQYFLDIDSHCLI